MYVYAGIDEAGYGPLFGPLLVSRTVIGIPNLHPDDDGSTPPNLWQRLSKAVCRSISDRRGRIAVNDSKKLHTAASGIKHLERGVLSFVAMANHHPTTVDTWLDCLGENCHRSIDPSMPWYLPTNEQPWSSLPCAITPGEVAVAKGLLTTTATRIGVELLDIGAAVVLEDQFNEMVASTRSKAATSFTFVAKHLRAIWDNYGHHNPTVIVDRQSGRVRYRELLAMAFPDADLKIMDETPQYSGYALLSTSENPTRKMKIRFEVDGDGRHIPVALASMISKYTRELLMMRFKNWFAQKAPHIKPTAGYGRDAKRFWEELQPILPKLQIESSCLRRHR